MNQAPLGRLIQRQIQFFFLKDNLPKTTSRVWLPLSMTYRNTFEFDSVKHVI